MYTHQVATGRNHTHWLTCHAQAGEDQLLDAHTRMQTLV